MTPAQWWLARAGKKSTKKGCVFPVTVSDLGLGAPPAWATPDGIAERVLASELTEICEALRLIPSNCGYDEWYRLGAAIHHFDSSERGLALFTAWSRTSPAHADQAAEACERKWVEYGKPKDGRTLVTKATIYHEAEKRRGGREPASDEESDPAPGIDMNGNHVLPQGFTVASITAIPAAPANTPPLFFPDFDAKGNLKSTMSNAAVAIQRLGVVCRRDLFHDRMTVGGHAIQEWAGDLTDDALHMLRRLIKDKEGFDPGPQNTHDAAVQLCLINQYDPVLDYLGGLRWDGVRRVEAWLVDYMQAPDTPLTRAASHLVLTAAVRRARIPGCKFDQITVLESGEGKNKSTALEIMAGADNFSDQTILGKSDREQQESLSGVWLYEIADLAGSSRAEVERVKAFASRRVDRARPAYGRIRVDKPRRCVLWATTNESTYLISQTGNRRFWPVKVGRIDLDALARDRDQLWAEAAHREAQGVALWLPEELWSEAGAAQAERMEQDPWDTIIEGMAGTRYESPDATGDEYRISTRELMDAHLQLPRDKQTTASAKRLAYVMRRCGWSGPVAFKDKSGVIVKGYTKTA